MSHNLPKPTRDDVERISRGKSSRSKIGSIFTGHRLTKHERQLVERAIENGFILLSQNERENTLNIYEKFCQVEDMPVVLLEDTRLGVTLQIWWYGVRHRALVFPDVLKNKNELRRLLQKSKRTDTLFECDVVDRKNGKRIAQDVVEIYRSSL